jgi:GMP synthase-like glutamine amidotransferase
MARKKILIIQFRKDKKTIDHERRCFLKVFKKEKRENFSFIFKNIFDKNVEFKEDLLSKIDGIILGGSAELFLSKIKDELEAFKRLKKIEPLIKKAIKKEIPILGICFGHQYLAHLLGAQVVRDLKQEEVGTYKIYLTKRGEREKIFSGISKEFWAQEGHKESVKRLPKKAILLAKSKKCKIESFCYKNVLGVQFHPELEKEDIEFRLKRAPDYRKGKIFLKNSPQAKKVLINFLKICKVEKKTI